MAKRTKRGGGRRKHQGPTCEECFFHRRGLCALELDEPCSTFRPDGPQGLVPPQQPTLLMYPAPSRAAAPEPAFSAEDALVGFA